MSASAVTDALEEATLAELRGRMAANELSALDLTRYYLERIERYNPELRAVIEVNPDAENEARRLDAAGVRGPLHGIPVLLKDNIDTADAMHTTSGSTALLGSRPAQDATVAAKLRAAGAILLGKANKTSWIIGAAGWSARGGQCRNPYQLDHSPHGSSSGSAVGVAANLCAAALGTETVGSILGPASANCVVGFKPTVGLTSRAGMIPAIRSFDSIGPLCRTVADAALVLSAIAGVDPRDSATAGATVHTDYTKFLVPEGLRGARIGVPRSVFFGYSAEADAITEHAIEVMRAAGAEIVDNTEIATAAQLTTHPAIGMVVIQETKYHLERYLADTPGDHPKSIAELVEFNRSNASVELVHFGQGSLEMLAGFGDVDLDSPAYHEALATVRSLAGVDEVLRQHGLDALVMPTCPPAWPIDLVEGDPEPRGAAVPAGVAGYPAVSVPAGFADGLPVGITFTGTAWSEPTLFRLANGFEQALPVRRAPRLAER
ncbi:amidase family protein [Allokutzneria sp. A3M-2-11 16]|uniref:amidase family protein n=1 Tax=Allokutzneria sp. A3M-2-11 16 TaxID=2962043 RepID=UPI0020B65D35|nr:amidase family protein [Allokutzneria sp. A3M-2-11 16]MCP3804552.1 amidase family protein [Allokutzneria sp. A3M-2-11 16]